MPKYQNQSDGCFPKGMVIETTRASATSITFRDPNTGRGRVRPAHYWVEVRETVATDQPRKTWIISLLEGGKLLPSHTPVEYSSEKQAHAVAKSMAEKHRGKTFVVFEATGFVHLPLVQSTEVIRL